MSLSFILVCRASFADADRCDGPSACCPDRKAHVTPAHVETAIGVVLVGVSDINERAGTWAADYYLYESWPAGADFTPQTDVTNEVERQSVVFDSTDLRDGHCVRSRRIHSTLRTEFNLRRFPFDRQELVLQFSDDDFTSEQERYAAAPYLLGVDDTVRSMVSGWKLDGAITSARESKAFAWEPGAPRYDYETFRLPVRRHVSFHLTRYLLPLLIIVAVSFAVFWVDPEELSSRLSIGVTCLLAAIALQFSEVATLPAVSYLTLVDRIYVVCYVAIASTIVEIVYANASFRAGRKERAMRVDRRCRILFPALLVLSVALSTLRAFTQT